MSRHGARASEIVLRSFGDRALSHVFPRVASRACRLSRSLAQLLPQSRTHRTEWYHGGCHRTRTARSRLLVKHRGVISARSRQLLAISVHLENPLGDDPADLPALAYQVWMKKECESFSAGVDAIEFDVPGGWWEELRRNIDGAATVTDGYDGGGHNVSGRASSVSSAYDPERSLDRKLGGSSKMS